MESGLQLVFTVVFYFLCYFSTLAELSTTTTGITHDLPTTKEEFQKTSQLTYAETTSTTPWLDFSTMVDGFLTTPTQTTTDTLGSTAGTTTSQSNPTSIADGNQATSQTNLDATTGIDLTTISETTSQSGSMVTVDGFQTTSAIDNAERASFKCSKNYSIAFQSVCDGKEDCPYGNDERYCGGCPSHWHTWREYLYFVETETKIFEEARQSCEDLGGHVTSVFDFDEIEFLSYLGQNEINFWIGFTDEEEGIWKWEDGSQTNFTFWDEGQPNNLGSGQDCTELLSQDGGKWNDGYCDETKNAYVCKKPVTGGEEEIQLLLYGKTDVIQESIHGACSLPLGMSDNRILDNQISASSYLDDSHHPWYARLLNESYWVPSQADRSPWIQISFGQEMVISGVITDGHFDRNSGWVWIESFYLTYSHNGIAWKPYAYFNENNKIDSCNAAVVTQCGQYTCKHSVTPNGEQVTTFISSQGCRRSLILYHQLKATHLRLHPIVNATKQTPIACKLELMGCLDNDCDYSLGVASGGITQVNLTSSSVYDEKHTSITARLGIIPEIGLRGSGWIPSEKDSNPWLRIDMETVHDIRALATQGCGDQLSWVTDYCVSTEVETGFYFESNMKDYKVFYSHNDSYSIKRNSINTEIKTSSIIIHPKAWVNRPCLRVEVIGCASEPQRCEIDHVASCEFTRECSYPSGKISTLNFPVPYPQRTTCTWRISTEAGTFILLSFLEFDIPSLGSLGDCSSSYVSIYNGGFEVDDALMGSYCNYHRPPAILTSAFNQMFLSLNTGAEEPGFGFVAEYTQSSLSVKSNMSSGSEDICPSHWRFFKSHCYRLFNLQEPINWINAETKCQEVDAALVSIRDKEDMEFIHSMIVNSLGQLFGKSPKIYIGLRMDPHDWVHRWVDGRPLSYSDWMTSLGKDRWSGRQPDGGRLESCVLIELSNIHSTSHWHDVPCFCQCDAYQYICMKRAAGANCPKHMKSCKNRECIHKPFACADPIDCQLLEECRDTLDDEVSIIRGTCRRPGDFQCHRSHECISISFVCDFISHCKDKSDEEFCIYPSCENDQFTCSNGECIDLSKRCDIITDCIDRSDEELCNTKGFQCYDGTWLPEHAQCDGQRDCSGKNWEDEALECDIYQSNNTCGTDNGELLTCKSGACVDWRHKCVYNINKYGFLDGCRDATHLEICDNFECGVGLLKCPNSYCIPLRHRCDGNFDCPNGEDENECGSYNCPGYYRCQEYEQCVNTSEVCDGVKQCPKGDDELFCDIACPEGCLCMGLYFYCMESSWGRREVEMVPDTIRELHLINLQHQFPEPSNKLSLFVHSNRMKHALVVHISGNGIAVVDSTSFTSSVNLQILSLSNNSITHVPNGTFANLILLKHLDLANNPLKLLDAGAFINLHSLLFLNISSSLLEHGLQETFADLSSLESLHSDKYLFCCLVANLPSLTECLPHPDQFSSCEDLIRLVVLRVFIWILGISAIVGNAYVIVRRLFLAKHRGPWYKRGAVVQNILISNLAIADSLMGVYMIIIASADVHYRDRYAFYAEDWQTSVLCKMAGLISVLSSESSVFFMTVISLDRFFVCVFPLSKKMPKLKPTSAKIIAIIVWFAAFLLSLFPLMIPDYFGNAFYGRSSVCLALPLTIERPAGWEYSVFLFLVVNLVAFLIILICYACIYYKAKSASSRAKQTTSRAKENELALRMAALVFSDMFCWLPIVIMDLLSLSGNVEVPSISYAWIAVFVLPLNSSLNPYLYTIVTNSMAKIRVRGLSRKSTRRDTDMILMMSNTGK